MIEYNSRNWFWFVGGDETRIWSSAAALATGIFADGYITLPDQRFDPESVTHIASEIELRDLQIAVVSGLEILARLTDVEYSAIRQAETANYATVGRWLDALRVNGQINLFGLTAEAARAGLSQTGLLAAERISIVFSAAI